MKRLIGAIKKYLFKDTKYFLWYSLRHFNDNYRCHCNFYTREELAKEIAKGRSFMRLGDGEIAGMHYLDITPQKYNPILRNEFIEMIEEYSDNSPYILAIPIFVNYSNRELDDLGSGKKELWMPLKITFDMIFNRKAHYFDAHLFYREKAFEEIVVPTLKSKKVILITNQRNIEITKGLEFSILIHHYIVCPDKNAHDSKQHLIDEILKYVDESGIPKNEFMILASIGSAKTLVYEISKAGIQILDVGTGYEGYAKGINLESRI